MYIKSTPSHYEEIACPFGIVGAIAVEASPWHADNFWLLDQVRASPFMLGFVGNLAPGTSGFADDLARLGKEDLFLGIRYGNLWQRDLTQAVKQPAFVADLRRLQQSGRTLDTANPDPQLIASTLALSHAIPDLRIVMDHLPNATVPSGSTRQFTRDLTELAQNPNVFMKLSEVPQKVGDRYRFDLDLYQEKLDGLWDIFGEDRIVFGSDFPNSIPVGTPAQIFSLTQAYLTNKSVEAQAKVFFANSRQLYRWHARDGGFVVPA
jgi:L-fuconolactonase